MKQAGHVPVETNPICKGTKWATEDWRERGGAVWPGFSPRQTKPICRPGSRQGSTLREPKSYWRVHKVRSPNALRQSRQLLRVARVLFWLGFSGASNKMPTPKVRECGFDPRFWASIRDQFGRSRLLAGAPNEANSVWLPLTLNVVWEESYEWNRRIMSL
jgi:hypothetical protein